MQIRVSYLLCLKVKGARGFKLRYVSSLWVKSGDFGGKPTCGIVSLNILLFEKGKYLGSGFESNKTLKGHWTEFQSFLFG